METMVFPLALFAAVKKEISPIRAFFCALTFCLAVYAPRCSAQEPYFDSFDTVNVPVWVYIEAPPDGEEEYWYDCRGRLEDAALFLGGLCAYGWKITYVPYDKARGVSEFFEFEPILSAEDLAPLVEVRNQYEKDGVLFGSASVAVPSEYMRRQKAFEASGAKVSSGSGEGSLKEANSGFAAAIAEAVKEAARAYGRSVKKNKPKEISAYIRPVEPPRVRASAGRYIANITIFMDSIVIIPYSAY